MESTTKTIEAYWNTGKDVYFVQVWRKDVNIQKPGLYYRWGEGKPGMFNLVAVTDSPTVTRSEFEDVMTSFINGLPPPAQPETLVSFPV